MRHLIVAALFCLPAIAFAGESSKCDQPKNSFDDLYCLNKVFQETDNQLNAAYQKLNAKLNSEGKAKLKRGQLAWMRERNDSCSETRGNEFLVNLRCATNTTRERLQFLQDRHRECVSAGCRNSQLEP